MDTGLAIAIASGISAVLVALIRSGMKHWSETQLNRAKIMKEIADSQRSESTRVVDMMIAQARSDAKLIEEIHLNGQKIEAAVELRAKMDDTVLSELREMGQLMDRSQNALGNMCRLVERLQDTLNRYVDETQNRTVYRPKRSEE